MTIETETEKIAGPTFDGNKLAQAKAELAKMYPEALKNWDKLAEQVGGEEKLVAMMEAKMAEETAGDSGGTAQKVEEHTEARNSDMYIPKEELEYMPQKKDKKLPKWMTSVLDFLSGLFKKKD